MFKCETLDLPPLPADEFARRVHAPTNEVNL